MHSKFIRLISNKNLSIIPENEFATTIRSITENSKLLWYYKPNTLPTSSLSLILQRANENNTNKDQFKALFESKRGLSFLTEVVQKQAELSLTDYISLFEILASTTSVFNKIFMTSEKMLELSNKITNLIDPNKDPELLIRLYKACALLKKSTFLLETKVLRLLESEFQMPYEDFLGIVESAILLSNKLSLDICKKAYSQLVKMDTQNLSTQSLVKTFRLLTKLYYYFHLGENKMSEIRDQLLAQQNSLRFLDILAVLETYKSVLLKDERLLNAAIGNILSAHNLKDLFWGNNLVKLIESLCILKIRKPSLCISEDLGMTLMEKLCMYNKINRLNDFQFYKSLNQLTKFVTSLPMDTEKYLLKKLEINKDFKFQIYTSILLTNYNNKELIKLVVENQYKVKRSSTEANINLYLWIHHTDSLKNLVHMDNLKKYIEEETANRITDFKSLRDTRSLLNYYYFELRDKKLFSQVVLKIIETEKALVKSGNMLMIACLKDSVNLNCSFYKTKAAWAELFNEFKEKINRTIVTAAVETEYRDYCLEAIVDILYYGKSFSSSLAHCLGVKIEEPTNRLLRHTAELVSNADWFRNFKINWPGPTLFNQLFFKGYGNDLELFFNSLRYLELVKYSKNNVLDILKIHAQYGNFKKESADIVVEHMLDEVLSNESFIVAIGTANFEFFIKNFEKTQKFFCVNIGDGVLNVVEKVNLYLKLEKFPGFMEFEIGLFRFLNSIQGEPDLLVEILQLLSADAKNCKEYLVEKICDFIVFSIVNAYGEISDKLLCTMLFNLLKKFDKHEAHISAIEKKIKFIPKDADTAESLIKLYLKKSRKNTFLDKLFIIGLTTLDDNTFITLTNSKNHLKELVN